jgi:hypothetical protein
MEQIKKRKNVYKAGDLVYVDVLTVAKYDWEFAILGGNILSLKDTVPTFPKILCLVLDVRTSLKVAKVYIPQMGLAIKTPYKNLYVLGEIYDNN